MFRGAENVFLNDMCYVYLVATPGLWYKGQVNGLGSGWVNIGPIYISTVIYNTSYSDFFWVGRVASTNLRSFWQAWVWMGEYRSHLHIYGHLQHELFRFFLGRESGIYESTLILASMGLDGSI